MTKYADESEVFDTVPRLTKPDSIGKRFIEGVKDPVYGVGQIMDKVLVDPIRQAISPGATNMTDVIRAREAEYQAPEGVDWARIGGNVANPMTLLGPGKGKSVLTRTLAGRAATGGAVQGTLAPSTAVDDYWQDKLRGAALGGAVGGVAGKAATGLTPSPQARALMDMGIQPSVGQSVPGLNALEQKASSMFPGSVGAARGRAMQEWQEQIIQRTVPGARTLDEANDIASGMYKEVVPHLKPNPQAFQLVGQARTLGLQNPELTPVNQQVFEKLIADRFAKYGTMSGEGIKALDSDLGALIRKYGKSTDVSHHALADSLRGVQDALRQSMEVGLPPDLQGKMVAANKAWRELIPVNKAASSRADQAVTPRALQKALARQAGTDVTRMKADPLVDNAVDVFGSTVPDSGTAGRLLVPGAIGAGATGYLPHMLAAGVVARTGATRPVQAALLGNTALQQVLGQQSPAFTRALAAALRGTPNKPEDTTGYATDDEVFQ